MPNSLDGRPAVPRGLVVLGTLAAAMIVIAGLLGSMLNVLPSLVFFLVMLLFLTMDASAFPPLLARTSSSRPSLVNGLLSFADGTRRYMLVSTVFGLIVAVIDTIALLVLGI